MLTQPAVNGHHGDLDQVGGRALNRGVDGDPFGGADDLTVGAAQVRHVAPAAVQGGHIAPLSGAIQHAVHIALDPVIAGKVLVDIALGGLERNAQRAAQTVGTHAVDNPEIDRLGLTPLVCADRFSPEQFGRRPGVHVLAAAKRFDQDRVAAQVGQQPQLDLRVVGRHQQVARRRHKGGPDAAALFAPNRDVLQIRVAGRQAPGGRDGLVEGGMNPPGIGSNQLGQGIHIGALQLGKAAVGQDLGRQRIALGQPLQDRGVGRGAGLGFFAARQAQLVKQNTLELLGRGDVEFLTGQLIDFVFEPAAVLAELGRQSGQKIAVDQNTGQLHAGQDQGQGQLNLGEQRAHVLGVETREQTLGQTQGDIGVFARIAGRRLNRHLGKALFGPVGHFLIAGHAVVQMLPGQVVQIMPGGGIEQIRGQHGVAGQPSGPQPVFGQDQNVVFEVLADERQRRVLKQAAQGGQHGLARQLGLGAGGRMADRHIPGVFLADRQGDPDQLGIERIEGGRLGIQAVGLGRPDLVEHVLQLVGGADDFVASGLGRFVIQGKFPAGVQIVQQAAKLKLAEQLAQPVDVGLLAGQAVQFDLERHLAAQGRQFLGQTGQLAVVADPVAQLALDGVAVAEDVFEVVPLGDELHGCLLTHPGNARNIVGRVAHQGLDLDHPGGLDAELGPHLFDADELVFHGVEHGHPLGHQLHQVLVAGHQDDLGPVAVPAAGQGGQNVVGLIAGQLNGRNAVGCNDLFDTRDLLPQRVRHGLPVGLVVAVALVAKGLARRVKNDRQMARLIGVLDPLEHVHKAEDGVGRKAAGVTQLAHGVEGAVDVGLAVDQENPHGFVCHRVHRRTLMPPFVAGRSPSVKRADSQVVPKRRGSQANKRPIFLLTLFIFAWKARSSPEMALSSRAILCDMECANP